MVTVSHRRYYTHTIVGLVLMLGIGFMPPLEPLTKAGMQVGGIFLGLLYLWTTVGILWPSLLGLGALAMTDGANIAGVLAASFGNNVVVMMIFILALVGVAENAGIPAYIIQWIMTRKVIEGRPWVFTIIILLGTYATAVVGGIVAAFLFWSILYKLFEDVGFKKGDQYTKLLLFGVAYATCLGTFLMPFHGMGLLLTGTMQSALPGSSLDYASYIAVMLVISLLSVFMYILAMKWIFRSDVAPLKAVKVAMFEENKLPPMSKLQKFLFFYLGLMLVMLLLPSFLPKAWLLTQKLGSAGPSGMILILFSILCIIQVEGKSLVNFADLAHKKIAWELVFLTAIALAISSLLTKPETGITAMLTQVLNPVFLNKGLLAFVFLLCLLTIILTNLTNNGVIAMLMMSVACIYAGKYQLNPATILVLLAYGSNIAFLLPASSMFGAIVHGNDWLETKDIYQYALFVAAVGLVVTVLVGFPLANMLV